MGIALVYTLGSVLCTLFGTVFIIYDYMSWCVWRCSVNASDFTPGLNVPRHSLSLHPPNLFASHKCPSQSPIDQDFPGLIVPVALNSLDGQI